MLMLFYVGVGGNRNVCLALILRHWDFWLVGIRPGLLDLLVGEFGAVSAP